MKKNNELTNTKQINKPLTLILVVLSTLLLLSLVIIYLFSLQLRECNTNNPSDNTETSINDDTQSKTTPFIPKDGTGTLSKIVLKENDNEQKCAFVFTDSITKEEKILKLDNSDSNSILIGQYYYQLKDTNNISRTNLFSGEKEDFELEMNPNFVIVDYYVRDNVIYYLSGIDFCTWYCTDIWCGCPSIDLQAYHINTNEFETLSKDMTTSPSNSIDGFDDDGNLIFSFKFGDAGEYLAYFRKYDFSKKKVVEIGNVDSWCPIDEIDEESDCVHSGSLPIDYPNQVITTVKYVKRILFENGKMVVSSLEKSNEELEGEFIRVGTSVSDLQYYYPLQND